MKRYVKQLTVQMRGYSRTWRAMEKPMTMVKIGDFYLSGQQSLQINQCRLNFVESMTRITMKIIQTYTLQDNYSYYESEGAEGRVKHSLWMDWQPQNTDGHSFIVDIYDILWEQIIQWCISKSYQSYYNFKLLHFFALHTYKDIQIIMGASSPKPSIQTTKNQSNPTDKDCDEQFDPQIQQMGNCCGVLQKKKKPSGMLNWEDSAVVGCQRAGEGVCWVQAIKQVVKKKGGHRKKFIHEYNDIKYLQKQPTKAQQETPLNAAQISNFKSNLKKSVLIHPAQVLYPNQANTNLSFRQSLRQSLQQQNPNSSTAKQNNTQNKGSFINRDKITQNRDDSILSFSRITKAVNRQNLRQSVLGLVDDTVSTMFKGEEEQVMKLNAYQLDVFVKFTIMLERHLTHPQHKISQIITAFCSSIYKAYPLFTHPNSSSTPLPLLQMQHFLDTIKLFLTFLAEIVIDYYNLYSATEPPLPKDTTLSVIQLKSFHSSMNNQDVSNHLINNFQNILTIVTAILFKDQKFYSFVFEAVKIFNRENDERSIRLFSKLHGRGPEYFNVKKQYSLNQGTLKNILDGMSLQSNIQNLVPEDLYSTTEQPYRKCAESLQKIEKQRTPISKMKSILECAQKITEQITQFYESNNTNINGNYKKMDADQVLSIFCYILSISKISDIFSHCFIVEHFATQFQKIGMTGYYFTVFSCAVEQNFGESRQMREEKEQKQGQNKSKEKNNRKDKNEQQIQSDIKNQGIKNSNAVDEKIVSNSQENGQLAANTRLQKQPESLIHIIENYNGTHQ